MGSLWRKGVKTLRELGYEVHSDVLEADFVEPLREAFAAVIGHRPGDRVGLAVGAIQAVAGSRALRSLVESELGRGAVVLRALLFNKNDTADWMVAWHQDRMLPIHEGEPMPGWGTCSRKPDGPYAEPPVDLLQQVLAVRVDVDGSGACNGGLRVIAGTHAMGVLPPQRIAELVAERAPECPEVPERGALVMRPLLLHCSTRSQSSRHRRIVHFECAPHALVTAAPLRIVDSVASQLRRS